MLGDIVARYLAVFPDEADDMHLLRFQIAEGEALNVRTNFRGHATGAAIVLSPDNTSVLMIRHRIFKTWLQPGGHMEPNEENPVITAQREAIEETGVQISKQVIVRSDPTLPIHLESHYIPANDKKGEPEHYHHDFQYVFRAASLQLVHRQEEVHEAAWVAFDDLRAESIECAISKLRRFKII